MTNADMLPVSKTTAQSRYSVFRSLLAACCLSGSIGAQAGSAEIVFDPNGVGVGGETGGPVPDQINQDPGTTNSQALLLDFGKRVYNVKVTVSNLYRSEKGCAEVGRWTAFSSAGFQSGTALLNKDTLNYGSSAHVGEQKVAIPGPMRFIAFSAEPYGDIDYPDQPCANPPTDDSSDYYVRKISFMYLDANGNLVEGSLGSDGTDGNSDQWNGVALDGYEAGTSFKDDNDVLLSPDGEKLAEIRVSSTECSAEGENNSDCLIPFIDNFTTTVQGDDVNGTLTGVAYRKIVDHRLSCGGDGETPDAPAIIVDDASGESLNLGYVIGKDAQGHPIHGPVIPGYLCGIPTPNADGAPLIELLEIDGSKLRTALSVIKHEVENPANTSYLCPPNGFDAAWVSDPKRSRLPVVGWLPRDGEIPVLDPYGYISPMLEDVTYGCGSYRGGSSVMSFLVYNLHHRDDIKDPGYRSIIDQEFTQLRATVQLTEPCVQNGVQTSTLEAKVDKAYKWFNNKRYARSKAELIDLRGVVESADSRIGPELPQCFVDPDDLTHVVGPDPTNPDLLHRNIRGDMLVQIDHILYMMEAMLGVLNPPR